MDSLDWRSPLPSDAGCKCRAAHYALQKAVAQQRDAVAEEEQQPVPDADVLARIQRELASLRRRREVCLARQLRIKLIACIQSSRLVIPADLAVQYEARREASKYRGQDSCAIYLLLRRLLPLGDSTKYESWASGADPTSSSFVLALQPEESAMARLQACVAIYVLLDAQYATFGRSTDLAGVLREASKLVRDMALAVGLPERTAAALVGLWLLDRSDNGAYAAEATNLLAGLDLARLFSAAPELNAFALLRGLLKRGHHALALRYLRCLDTATIWRPEFLEDAGVILDAFLRNGAWEEALEAQRDIQPAGDARLATEWRRSMLTSIFAWLLENASLDTLLKLSLLPAEDLELERFLASSQVDLAADVAVARALQQDRINDAIFMYERFKCSSGGPDLDQGVRGTLLREHTSCLPHGIRLRENGLMGLVGSMQQVSEDHMIALERNLPSFRSDVSMPRFCARARRSRWCHQPESARTRTSALACLPAPMHAHSSLAMLLRSGKDGLAGLDVGTTPCLPRRSRREGLPPPDRAPSLTSPVHLTRGIVPDRGGEVLEPSPSPLLSKTDEVSFLLERGSQFEANRSVSALPSPPNFVATMANRPWRRKQVSNAQSSSLSGDAKRQRLDISRGIGSPSQNIEGLSPTMRGLPTPPTSLFTKRAGIRGTRAHSLQFSAK